ncbi:MAG: alpha-glucosidase C-terminal domain-containing protein [Bacteroidota bacterium]
MRNTVFKSQDELRDIAAINAYKEGIKHAPIDLVMKGISEITRDQGRTPFQWDNTSNAGFTSGEPWLKVNPDYVSVSVKSEVTDPNSILNFYKKIIRLRKENKVLISGAFKDIAPGHTEVYAYTRSDNDQKWLIILNMTANQTKFKFPDTSVKLMMSNYTDDQGESLRPYEAKIYKMQTQ